MLSFIAHFARFGVARKFNEVLRDRLLDAIGASSLGAFHITLRLGSLLRALPSVLVIFEDCDILVVQRQAVTQLTFAELEVRFRLERAASRSFKMFGLETMTARRRLSAIS